MQNNKCKYTDYCTDTIDSNKCDNCANNNNNKKSYYKPIEQDIAHDSTIQADLSDGEYKPRQSFIDRIGNKFRCRLARTDYECPICGATTCVLPDISQQALPSEITFYCSGGHKTSAMVDSCVILDYEVYSNGTGKFVPPYYHITAVPTDPTEYPLSLSDKIHYQCDL